ncbi:bifunctional phosphopantothenoylcysteine decarboxylase/phosphopantothenate--cysteine ligase CoaBC [Corynebacterium felinum]
MLYQRYNSYKTTTTDRAKVRIAINAHNHTPPSHTATTLGSGRNIVVGVAGGIAAYKACHLIRDFKEAGDIVRVVPTEAALQFVGKATFEALSGNPVSTTVFDAVDEVRHVHVGQQADLIVVAPATADLIARVTHGRADDLLAATILMATCPVVLAPAMHTEMWENKATQANVDILRSRGIVVLEPAHGRLTGTDTGPGRLPEPSQIATLARAAMEGVLFDRSLEGKKILITAGGTREALDPVRFLGNHSSGRQGFALAEIAAHRGAEVTIIAGSIDNDLHTPSGARIINVSSAREMYTEVHRHVSESDLVIMAAAVADFRPAHQAESKMKKGSEAQQALERIELIENPDILRAITTARATGEIPSDLVVVGFAAETGDENTSALEFARIKLTKKDADFLMCNEVGEGKVFGQPKNSGFLLSRTGEITEIETADKHVVAGRILDVVTQKIR